MRYYILSRLELESALFFYSKKKLFYDIKDKVKIYILNYITELIAKN